MSLTPLKQKRMDGNPQLLAAASFRSSEKTPILQERHDRYCCRVSVVMEKAALEKFPGQKCGRCNSAVEYRAAGDGLWRRCVRCDVFLRCTFKFCYMCGRSNQHFNPQKVQAKETEMKAHYFQLFRSEMEEEAFMNSQAEVLEKSQGEVDEAKTDTATKAAEVNEEATDT